MNKHTVPKQIVEIYSRFNFLIRCLRCATALYSIATREWIYSSSKSLCSDHSLRSIFSTPPRHCVMFPSPMPVACALLFLWVCVLVPDRALLSARSNGWTSGQASLVVAPLVSLVKAKVCNSLLDQYNVMEGREKHTTRPSCGGCLPSSTSLATTNFNKKKVKNYGVKLVSLDLL